MRTLRNRPILLSAGLIVALAVSTPAMGQPWDSYAAKFVCGRNDTPPPPSLAFGNYKTIVNIHNPHTLMDPTGLEVPLVFFKKAVLAVPQGGEPLPPSCKVQERLKADHALQVDCRAIKGLLALSGLPSTGNLEGFLVIEVPPQPVAEDAPPPLDVVTVYTGRDGAAEVSTLDVERVPRIMIRGRPADDPCG